MKTKEFIEKVKKLGFGIEYYKNPLSNVGLRCDYDLFTIYLEDKDLVEIWTNCRYAISTISDGHSCFINGYDVEELYKLCFEYASTPVGDREEEKKFLIKHKYLVSKANCQVNLAKNKEKNVYRVINCKNDNLVYQTQFTFNEIEKIKEELNTDLSDFELIEVEE